MTPDEVQGLVRMAVANTPSVQARNMGDTAELWLVMLGDLPFEVARAALLKVLSTSRFWPTVADIRDAAASFIPSDIPLAEIAWGEVLRNVQKVGYTHQPEWTNAVIGKVVDAMYGSWHKCCETMHVDMAGVDRRQFLDMYTTITKRERERALLPPAVRELTDQLGHVLRLPTSQRKAEVNDS